MPVPASINDLSTTAGSNSPSGSETPTEGDNYIRTYGAFIAALRDKLDGTSSTGTLTSPTITSPTISGGTWATTAMPAFRAYRVGVSDQTSGSAAVFGTEQFDRTSSYNTTTGVFTVPTTGHYFFTACLVVDGATADFLKLEASTTGILAIDRYPGTRTYVKLSAVAYLTSGETVSIKLVSGSDFSANTFIEGGATPSANQFSGAMIY